MMTPAMAAFSETLTGTTIGAPQRPVVSNVTAAVYDNDAAAIRRGLADQLASPVRFAESVETLYRAGARVFVEVGPGAVLTGLVDQCLEEREHLAVSLDGKGATVMAGSLMVWALSLLPAFRSISLSRGMAIATSPVRELKPVPGSVMIDGSNYGKPFPPSADMPPVPIRVQPSIPSVIPVSQDRVMPPVESPPPAIPVSSPVPQAAAPVFVAAQTEVLAAFERIHAQAAEAHRSTQQAMAEAHLAYLRTTEATLARLQGMLGGTSGAPMATAAAQPVWTAPVAVPPR